MKKARLRSGFTTGACAAAAAKAALVTLMGMEGVREVEIPFPDGLRRTIAIKRAERIGPAAGHRAIASVIKDAGDDPDVTNGAEITAEIRPLYGQGGDGPQMSEDGPGIELIFRAGPGVGMVTRPGLALPPGEPAINPGPRKMIRAAVIDGLKEAERAGKETGSGRIPRRFQITLSIRDGQALAHKTLNARLGIEGGLSILGTTGIVRPVSAKAWTDTIDVSLNVAWESGCREVLLSTGRTSERVVQGLLALPDEALIMMGDYLEHTLKSAGRYSFDRLHVAGMWAKVVKAALEIPQTHVRHGALEPLQAVALLEELSPGGRLAPGIRHLVSQANTARHILEILQEHGQGRLIRAVCLKARDYCQRISGHSVTLYLVSGNRQIIEKV